MIFIEAFLSPFWCFIKGLINYRKPNSKYYILVFILFYAFSMTFPIGETNMDIFRRIESFNLYASQPNISIIDVFNKSYSDDSDNSNADIFEALLLFLVTRFTDNIKIMFVVWAFCFGLLFVNNIWYLIEKNNLKINKINLIWVIALFLIIPFWNINAFRFWTAAHLFIFGLLRFFYTKKKSYLFFSFFSAIIHFSFIIPNFLLIFFFILPKNLIVANFLFLFTSITSNFNIQKLNQLFIFLPSGISGKTNDYTSDYYLTRVNEFKLLDTNFYISLRYKLVLVAFELLFLFIYFNYKNFLKVKLNTDLFFLTFILLSFSNLVFSIPPLDRFFNLGAFFMFIIGVNFANFLLINKLNLFKFKYISSLLILYLLVEIRIGFDTISIVSIIGNPVTQYFVSNDNFSLIDIFK